MYFILLDLIDIQPHAHAWRKKERERIYKGDAGKKKQRDKTKKNQIERERKNTTKRTSKI